MKHSITEQSHPSSASLGPAGTMRLSSPAFLEGQVIPLQYSKGGLNINPPLLIEGVPPGAKALVLLMDQRSSDRDVLTHWLLFNIDPKIRQISEECVPSTARTGANSWGELDYRGPEAALGGQQYHFRLMAVDRAIDLPEGAGRMAIEKAMRGHIVTEAVLTGCFPAGPG